MPVTFKIIPKRQLILFTYSGLVTLQESMDIVAQSACDPQYQPWQRHLCDLSAVTEVERDFLRLMQMQAKIAETFQPQAHDRIVLFYAPTKAGQMMAEMARKSWEGLNSVLVMVQHSEAQALAMLDLPEQNLQALLQIAESPA